MSSIKIDVGPFMRFAEKMNLADDVVRAALVVGGNKVSAQGAQIAKSILFSNGSHVSGGLYNSITPRPTQLAGSTIIMEYGPTEDYPAKWVEFGRGAVHARPGGSLRFQIKGKGPVIYTKSVGPARARPFMRPSVARLRPIASQILGNAAVDAIEGML